MDVRVGLLRNLNTEELMLLNCIVGGDSRIPWVARRSNLSILKEISPEYSLKGLMLILNLQYFGHLMWRTSSFGKTLMLGKIESRRWMGQQRMRWLDGITNVMDMNLSEFWVLLMELEAWLAAFNGITSSRTWPSDWTEVNWTEECKGFLWLFYILKLYYIHWLPLVIFWCIF